MTFKKLRITGSDGAAYELGQPMHVHDGELLLAVLDPVPVFKAGTEVHIEHFRPSQVVHDEQRHLGRLIFLEICEYIAEHFHQIQAISFSFAREVAVLGAAAEQANARAETVTRIGAINVQVAPNTDAHPGAFSVSGVWPYSEQNLAALRDVLEQQRAMYRLHPIGSLKRQRPGVRDVLRRLVRPGRA
jgi:hypothetical protein